MATMSASQAKLSATSDPEVASRISYANLRDFVALIRSLAGRELPQDDVEMLAAILSETAEAGEPLRRDVLMEELRRRGRSMHKARVMVDWIMRP